jgi:AraC-like DNA-binding protein
MTNAAFPRSQTDVHLLDNYPLIRTNKLNEARELIGLALSPHRLEITALAHRFEARHNQIRLNQVSLNVLSYGAAVTIDPGVRGDFYLFQLPLRGTAVLDSNGEQSRVDTHNMGVLLPRARTTMGWSNDCVMLMVHVPSKLLHQCLPVARGQACLPFPLTQSLSNPAVSAWWSALVELTRNLDLHGEQWLKLPAARSAMEAFLLSGVSLLHAQAGDIQQSGQLKTRQALQRALDFIHAHGHRSLKLDEVAEVACVSPRTLEKIFHSRFGVSPLTYGRCMRLDQVHQSLLSMAASGEQASVTQVALQNGFIHMGRFAAYYKARFGCAPSDTLRQA